MTGSRAELASCIERFTGSCRDTPFRNRVIRRKRRIRTGFKTYKEFYYTRSASTKYGQSVGYIDDLGSVSAWHHTGTDLGSINCGWNDGIMIGFSV